MFFARNVKYMFYNKDNAPKTEGKKMRYYIGIDLGTSSLKLLLVDNEGSIVNEVTKEYGVQYPKPNWSEQNPEDWWKALVAGSQELCNNLPLMQKKREALRLL